MHVVDQRELDVLPSVTTVRAQLNWCKAAGIQRAFIVHCGKQIVEMNAREAQHRVDGLAGSAVHATIAHDGMEVVLNHGRA